VLARKTDKLVENATKPTTVTCRSLHQGDAVALAAPLVWRGIDYVSGMTPVQAKQAIESHLAEFLENAEGRHLRLQQQSVLSPARTGPMLQYVLQKPFFAALACSMALAGGCASHGRPAAKHAAVQKPACYPCGPCAGYFPTCWKMWPEACPSCPVQGGEAVIEAPLSEEALPLPPTGEEIPRPYDEPPPKQMMHRQRPASESSSASAMFAAPAGFAGPSQGPASQRPPSQGPPSPEAALAAPRRRILRRPGKLSVHAAPSPETPALPGAPR
jgi:hypothetical protein